MHTPVSLYSTYGIDLLWMIKENYFYQWWEKGSIHRWVNIFLQYIFISEKEQLQLEKRILPVFPWTMFYKIIELSSAIWWLFWVGDNAVINTESREKISMGRKLLINDSEIILIDPNIFQTFFSLKFISRGLKKSI